MKESITLMSFSALLFASSGILSQPANEKSASTLHEVSDIQASALSSDTISTVASIGTNGTDLLILAKVNDINDSRSHRLNDQKSSKIDAIKTDIVVDASATKSTATDAAADAATQAATKNFSDEEIAHLRQLFLQAENALQKKDDASYFLLADQLKNYPLYPYLQYQWLKKHLGSERVC